MRNIPKSLLLRNFLLLLIFQIELKILSRIPKKISSIQISIINPMIVVIPPLLRVFSNRLLVILEPVGVKLSVSFIIYSKALLFDFNIRLRIDSNKRIIGKAERIPK